MEGSIIRETKSCRLVLSREEAYGLIEGYYRSGELPSVYYNRVGMSEAQFYKWRKRYLSEHPRLAERFGVTVRKDGGLSHPKNMLSIGCLHNIDNNVYLSPSVGLRLDVVDFGIGYELLYHRNSPMHSLYFKMGFRW